MQRLFARAVLLLVAGCGLSSPQFGIAEDRLEWSRSGRLTGGAIVWPERPSAPAWEELEPPLKFPFDAVDLEPPYPSFQDRVALKAPSEEQLAFRRLDHWLAEFIRRYPKTAAAQLAWKTRISAREQWEASFAKREPPRPQPAPRISGDTSDSLSDENRWILQLHRHRGGLLPRGYAPVGSPYGPAPW